MKAQTRLAIGESSQTTTSRTMTHFIISFILCIALLLLALLFSLSPFSEKAKTRVMYAGAVISLAMIPIMTNDICKMDNAVFRIRYQCLQTFVAAVGFFCFAMAFIVKLNVAKRKNEDLQATVKQLEQERAKAMVQEVGEEQQERQKAELRWLAGKMSVFTEEEQSAINTCVLAFVERNKIEKPSISIAINDDCSQADLMYYVYLAMCNLSKKRSDTIDFLLTVFNAYFSTYTHDRLGKKLPGLDASRERRKREDGM